jgi:hypothetical protein
VSTSRAQYSQETKERVYWRYPLLLSREDRLELAREEKIESLAKLYNLASRLEATRGHDLGEGPWSDPERLLLRIDPDTHVWLPKHDRYIRSAWRKLFIEQIAFRLDLPEIAVAYRARQLGLRAVCHYWDAKKVVAWLGISGRELLELASPPAGKHGLELYPQRNRRGEFAIMLASATSLARVLAQDGLWKRLVDERNADKFFMREILESSVALQLSEELAALRERQNRGERLTVSELERIESLERRLDPHGGEHALEPNPWVSHGHTALNPRSEGCFGLFFTGYDDKMEGFDIDPADVEKSLRREANAVDPSSPFRSAVAV